MLKTSDKTDEINKALIEAIPVIKNLYPSAKGYGYDYIPLEDIIDEIKAKLKNFGLAVIQMPVSPETLGEKEQIGVLTRIIHISGQFMESCFFSRLTELSKGSNTQKLGATVTYLRRYGLACVFGIAADINVDRELDDDKPTIKNKLENKIKDFNKLMDNVDKSKVDQVDKTNIQNTINLMNKGQITIKQIDSMITLLKEKYVK